jgi:hypothetical protein
MRKSVLGAIGVIWGGALAIGWIAGTAGTLPGVETVDDLGRWLSLAAAIGLIYYGGRYLREGLSDKGGGGDAPPRYVNPRSLPPPRRR